MGINTVKCQQCLPLGVESWVLLSYFFELLVIFPKFHKGMHIIKNILNKEAQGQVLNVYLQCMDIVHRHFAAFTETCLK